MKILFICPSQEPGRCGVGDYTRRLAEACVERGVASAIVALNDKHVMVNAESENLEIRKFAKAADHKHRNGGTQQETDRSIPLLRLSSALPWKDRVEQAREFVQAFAPDWVSLQYVPYGYDQRGLPFGLVARLYQICGSETQRHIFFHELWVAQRGLKMRLISILQQACLRWLSRRWTLHALETSNSAYERRLLAHGITAKVRPVFSNVPYAPSHAGRGDPKARNVPYRCVHFGKVMDQFPVDEAVRCVSMFVEAIGPIEVRALGSMRGGEHAWERFVSRLPKGAIASISGWLNDTKLSHELHSADLALVTSPLSLLGKSGAVAALRSHRVPFVVLHNDISVSPSNIRHLGVEGHLMEQGFDGFHEWRDSIPLRKVNDDVAVSTDLFLANLQIE